MNETKLIIRMQENPALHLRGMADAPLRLGLSVGGGAAGTDDYERLRNLPQINSTTLIGNRSLDELGIQPEGNYPSAALTNTDIENLINSFT